MALISFRTLGTMLVNHHPRAKGGAVEPAPAEGQTCNGEVAVEFVCDLLRAILNDHGQKKKMHQNI